MYTLKITLKSNDLYIYSPGLPITILSASNDYQSLGIMIDEQTALEIPTVRNLVSIAYKPIALLNVPFISLAPDDAHKLGDRIREMITYFNAEHIYKSQILQQLFSVFILDVHNIMETATNPQQIADRLHFADIASFSKFFLRMKGIAPREFRKGKE